MLQMVSVGAKIHISLDENLLGLKDALRDSGFKVTTYKQGTLDEELFHQLTQTLILTKNVEDFKVEAVRHDFDIIDVRQVKFIDTEKTRKNATAQKIATAIRNSGISHKKGYFQLVIQDSGGWDLIQLI